MIALSPVQGMFLFSWVPPQQSNIYDWMVLISFLLSNVSSNQSELLFFLFCANLFSVGRAVDFAKSFGASFQGFGVEPRGTDSRLIGLRLVLRFFNRGLRGLGRWWRERRESKRTVCVRAAGGLGKESDGCRHSYTRGQPRSRHCRSLSFC